MTAYLGALGAFTASVTWAFASTRYAALAREQGAVRVGLMRTIAASSLWMLWLACSDGVMSLARIELVQGLYLVGSIVCSYVLGDRVFFAAAARMGTSSALAIATIYPLWSALFGTFARGEPLGLRRISGIACCLCGVSAVLWMSREPGQRLSQSRNVVAGATLALLTSLFWAGNTVFLKLGAEGLSIQQANAGRYSLGLVMMLLQLRVAPKVAQPVSFGALVRTMRLPLLIDTGIGSIGFVYGIAHTDLALGATLSSLSPLVALPIAVALGTEQVNAGKVGAVCLTLLGVILLVTTATR